MTTTWTRIDDLRSRDGTRLALFRREPATPPKGDLLLVHGFADHMGRYEHVAKAFAEAGWRVTGLDLRGHGVSDGKRGFVADWADYMDDVSAAANVLTKPMIVAHSMGGLVILDWVRRHPDGARGLVISAPLLEPAVKAPRWKTSLAKVLTRILPSLPLGNEIPPGDVSRHPDIVKGYSSDPLVFSIATPRWYTEMIASEARVIESAGAYRSPLLCMWGTDDRIVSGPAIEAFTKRYGGPIETKVWPGLYHEIFNEPERDEVLAAAVAWLDKQPATPG